MRGRHTKRSYIWGNNKVMKQFKVYFKEGKFGLLQTRKFSHEQDVATLVVDLLANGMDVKDIKIEVLNK